MNYVIETYTNSLKTRYKAGKGFVNIMSGRARPDAACWAIIALQIAGTGSDLIEKGREQLVDAQYKDGRICISSDHKDTYWPTPLAILAWQGAPKYKGPQTKAIKFLLAFDEILTTEFNQDVLGHDGLIKGWPWVAHTHPWVEPTAYALIALRISGYGAHERAQDAVKLLIDRQLPHGGWNYGNTFVFKQELRPMPDTTGLALQALSGLVPREKIEKSILYLQSQLASLRTPIALGWTILGLKAWRQEINKLTESIVDTLQRQEEYEFYDTVSLGILLTAWYCENGLVQYLKDKTYPDDGVKSDE
jgi:hypothetical protein